MSKTTSAMCVVLVLMMASTALAVPLEVVITVDNAYGFGFGDANGITTYFGGIRNVTAGEIFNGPPGLVTGPPPWPYTIPNVGPELYQLNLASLDDYVYIVAWSDDATLQGALAGFQLPNGPLLTGGGWRVFATGIDRDSNIVGDTLTSADVATVINPQILLANANGGGSGTSTGWVDENGLLPNASAGVGELAIGPPNVTGSFFGYGPIQGISSDSRWMWYNEDPANILNPFQAGPEGSDGHNEFLIFRMQARDAVIPEPASATLVVMGLLAWGMRRRRKAS